MENKLQTGDYCEVTREQAIELLNIEGYEHPDHYAGHWSESGNLKFARYSSETGIILSGITHVSYMSFPDFKQRLINTVKK